MISQLVSSPTSEAGQSRIILAALPPDSYKLYAVTTARVYHTHFGAKHSDWTYSRLRGLLVFGRDRGVRDGEKSSIGHGPADAEKYWFRLIDETSGKVIWAFQIPAGFEYQLDRPFFHVFSGRSRMFGLLFDDDDDAATFSKKVVDRTCPNPVAKTRSTRQRSSTSRSARLSPSMISAPTPNSFVHVSHVGFNKNGVIETSKGLDPSWTTILADLQGHGVSKSIVLENLDFVEGFMKGVEAVKKSDSKSSATSAQSQTSFSTRKTRRKPSSSQQAL